MNVIQIVIRWYAEGDLNDKQLRQFLQDLSVEGLSIEMIMKRAQLARSQQGKPKPNDPQEKTEKTQ